PADFRMLTVDPKYVFDVLTDAGIKNCHLCPDPFRDDVLHAQLHRACATFGDPAADDLERECLVREVILRTFARRGEAALPIHCMEGADTSARRAREYVHAHACTRVTLDDVADAVCVSKYYLERAFHTKFGTPICKYLQTVKVDRAINLIRGG